jgi:hypothetical protein
MALAMEGARSFSDRPDRRRASTVTLVAAACAILLAGCDSYAAAGPAPSATPNPPPTLSAPADGGEVEPIDCVPPLLRDPMAVVQTIRRGDGSCLPTSEAVVYRCDPSAEPVAVLGGVDDPSTFLGGRFAVPTPSIPSRAQTLGITAAGRLSIIPGNDRWLYVEAGGSFERWLLLPEASAVGEPPTTSMIGDSILEGAAAALEANLTVWDVTIDAVIGRSSYGGVAAAQAATASPPDVVIVELGTNDQDSGAFSAYADQIATAVNDADLVMWVTAHNAASATAAVNRDIRMVMATMPNGAVADWDARVPLDLLSDDGVHLSAGSEAAFADFLSPYLAAWLEAVRGHGPTACGGEILQHNGG